MDKITQPTRIKIEQSRLYNPIMIARILKLAAPRVRFFLYMRPAQQLGSLFIASAFFLPLRRASARESEPRAVEHAHEKRGRARAKANRARRVKRARANESRVCGDCF